MISNFIPRLFRKFGFSRYFNFTIKINRKKKYIVPLRGDVGWAHLIDDEPWMSMLLNKLSKKISQKNLAFVDVGVNIGQTMLKAKSALPDFYYYGFEPNPICVAYVNELVKLNDLIDVEIFPFGVSNKAKIVDLNFFNDDPTDSSATLLKGFRPNQKIKKIEHVVVFPVSKNFFSMKIGILKIDVEGGELDVLLGFIEVIKKDRPIIIMEILPCYTSENTERIDRQNKIETLLNDEGYVCYRVLKKKNTPENLIGVENIESIGIHDDITQSDYLWIPNEIHSSVLASFND